MLFDVNKCMWSAPILNALELDEKVLSRPVPAGHMVGRVTDRAADEVGLNHDTVVVAGGHDQCCGALGVGVTGSGIAAYSIGTVECVTPAFDTCVLNETMRQSNFATYPYTIEGL